MEAGTATVPRCLCGTNVLGPCCPEPRGLFPPTGVHCLQIYPRPAWLLKWTSLLVGCLLQRRAATDEQQQQAEVERRIAAGSYFLNLTRTSSQSCISHFAFFSISIWSLAFSSSSAPAPLFPPLFLCESPASSKKSNPRTVSRGIATSALSLQLRAALKTHSGSCCQRLIKLIGRRPRRRVLQQPLLHPTPVSCCALQKQDPERSVTRNTRTHKGEQLANRSVPRRIVLQSTVRRLCRDLFLSLWSLCWSFLGLARTCAPTA